MNFNKSHDINQNTALPLFTISKDDSLLFYDNDNATIKKTHDEILFVSKTNPSQAIELTLTTTKKHPDEPIFAYHLERLYLDDKNHSFANQIAQDSYRRFPFYLLIRCRYALVCLSDNKLMEAASAVNYTFDLKSLYPDRTDFHFVEIITFYAFVVQYFCRLKDFNRAASYIAELVAVDKNLPVISQLSHLIFVDALEQTLSPDNIELLFSINASDKEKD